MDIDPLLCKDYLHTTKLIWLIDHCFHILDPCIHFRKDGKKMEIRREILRFLLRVHLATFCNSN